jgi:hypothetical protein
MLLLRLAMIQTEPVMTRNTISTPNARARILSVLSGQDAVALNYWGRRMRLKMPWWFKNLFGEQPVFLLSRGR